MPDITTSDSVRLAYTDEGGTGRPVVLVAGFRAPATSWVHQQEALREAGYRVLSLDRRSHGRSDDPPYGHRMARHGADLQDFLTALDLRDAVLVGGSMGASTIWSWAGLFDPSRVSAVVTVDQTPRMANSADWPHGFYGYDASNLGTLFAEGVPPTGRGVPPEQKLDKLMRVIAAMGLTPADLAAPKPFSAGELALLLDHATADWRDVVARLSVPALLVAGRDSEFWPCSHAEAAAALNPLAHHEVIEDCGHAANIEQPEQFNRLLLGFLADLG